MRPHQGSAGFLLDTVQFGLDIARAGESIYEVIGLSVAQLA
jgi:hypothetical protein